MIFKQLWNIFLHLFEFDLEVILFEKKNIVKPVNYPVFNRTAILVKRDYF